MEIKKESQRYRRSGRDRGTNKEGKGKTKEEREKVTETYGKKEKERQKIMLIKSTKQIEEE